MKAFLSCFLILALCGCGSAESKLRQENTVQSTAPVRQENNQESQTQSQLFGAQIAKVADEVSAFKSNVEATFKKLIEVNAKQVNGVKAELDARVDAAVNTNAKVLSDIEALKVEFNAKIDTTFNAFEDAKLAQQNAYEARIEQLQQTLTAGRDNIVQYTKEMADERIKEREEYTKQRIEGERQNTAVIALLCGVMVRMAMGSRNRCYRSHGKAHLVGEAPKWWQVWRA